MANALLEHSEDPVRVRMLAREIMLILGEIELGVPLPADYTRIMPER